MTGDYLATWRKVPTQVRFLPSKRNRDREKEGRGEGGSTDGDRGRGDAVSLAVHISKKWLPGP